MKRYVKGEAMVNPLRKEAQRVFDKLDAYPEVIDMVYVDDTDSYCIRFDPDAEDISYLYREMEGLGYKDEGEAEDESTRWSKGEDFRAWLYEQPDLELYISK